MVARQTVVMRVPRTFAFVDLSGFTRFTDLHGDDEAVAVLAQFRTAVRSIASDEGVRIAKWLGDGAMLVAVEGPSLVSAVVEVQERFALDGLLPVRAGLALGSRHPLRGRRLHRRRGEPRVAALRSRAAVRGARHRRGRRTSCRASVAALPVGPKPIPGFGAPISVVRLTRIPGPDPAGRRSSVPHVNTLRLERDGHVGRLVLARPDKLNSFTAEMWDELRTLGQELVADPGDLRALIVIGEGRAFSSGIDTSVFTTGVRAQRPRRRRARREPGGRHGDAHAGVVLVARDRAVRDHRRGARLRARRGSADRARVRHPDLRSRHERRPARVQVRDHPGPRWHAAPPAPRRSRARPRR